MRHQNSFQILKNQIKNINYNNWSISLIQNFDSLIIEVNKEKSLCKYEKQFFNSYLTTIPLFSLKSMDEIINIILHLIYNNKIKIEESETSIKLKINSYLNINFSFNLDKKYYLMNKIVNKIEFIENNFIQGIYKKREKIFVELFNKYENQLKEIKREVENLKSKIDDQMNENKRLKELIDEMNKKENKSNRNSKDIIIKNKENKIEKIDKKILKSKDKNEAQISEINKYNSNFSALNLMKKNRSKNERQNSKYKSNNISYSKGEHKLSLNNLEGITNTNHNDLKINTPLNQHSKNYIIQSDFKNPKNKLTLDNDKIDFRESKPFIRRNDSTKNIFINDKIKGNKTTNNSRDKF